ncbi:extracellular solute-binding protein [Paenibacillus eucommiae]|uniref:Aldouronate transport system substrate-binding protein n=1 Tax=Paenibacillus eucommiae TaxID=1355755 RepID=A0ABS4ISG8_9BACL|nr:extracellular solute-binding protein [Paenibacillus eucommiae]MBP1990517.1 putative aldouronate transport system substrate-binding protein [Paenibacillus eucommiae]
MNMQMGFGRKRWSVLVILVLSLMLLLAACSKSDGTKESGQDPAQTDGKKPESTKSAKKSEITISIYDRGNIPPEEGNATKNRWVDWINENSPVKVKLVPVPRWESREKFNALFASGEAPDLIFEWSTIYHDQLYEQKQLLPLDDWIEKYSTEYKALLNEYPLLRQMGTKSDGKLYGIGKMYATPLDTNQALYVRADWLEKLKLDVPKTTDELYAVIKAFAEQDPDGNNKKDTFGVNLSFVGGYILDNVFGAGPPGWIIQDGQYVKNWERETAAASFKKRLYDDRFVDKDFLTDQNGEKAQQDFVNGKLGIFGVNFGSGELGFTVFEALKKNNPDARVIAIPLPKSEFGQFSPSITGPMSITAVVNAKAKDPEAVVHFIDFMAKESTSKTLKYGLEGVHYQDGPNGCTQAIDPEKYQKEVSYALDLRMISSEIFEGTCGQYISQLNPEKPLEKEFTEVLKQAQQAYLTPERPVFFDITNESMPVLDQSLQLSFTNGLETIGGIWSKAIVGGTGYPIDKAAEDAKAAWQKAGGKALDDFYGKWFAENKDKIVYSKDWYKVGSK